MAPKPQNRNEATMERAEYVESVWKQTPHETHIPTEDALRAAFDDEPYRSVFGWELTYQIGNRPLNAVELGILAHNLGATLHDLGFHICRVPKWVP